MIQKEVIREILLENRKEVELQHVVPSYLIYSYYPERQGRSFNNNIIRKSVGKQISTDFSY